MLVVFDDLGVMLKPPLRSHSMYHNRISCSSTDEERENVGTMGEMDVCRSMYNGRAVAKHAHPNRRANCNAFLWMLSTETLYDIVILNFITLLLNEFRGIFPRSLSPSIKSFLAGMKIVDGYIINGV